MVTSISCVAVADAGHRHAEGLAFLARHIAAGEDDRVLLHVARADLDPQRHPAQLPIVELEARVELVPVVQLDPHARSLERRATSLASASTAARSASLRQIGTMTTWCGASRGGSIRPWSSPWAMMMAPTMRVLRPQLVVQA